MILVTRLIGGLGNQMFQYAVARAIAHSTGVPVKLDISGFQQYRPWSFALDRLNIKAEIASQHEIARFAPARSRIGRIAARLLRTVIPLERGLARERSFRFDPEILSRRGDTYLDGYWQSERYFKHIEGIIRDDFRVKTEPDKLNHAMAAEIASVEAVSVHVRRGDYISNPEANAYHGTCSLRYYERAIELVADAVLEPHLFVFSDDPEWTRANLHPRLPTTYVTHNGPDRHYEDLRLMSLCRHHVIANSSFSWWGAWLGNNATKTVIAPSRWFNNEDIDTSDLIPERWIKIDR